MFKEDNDHNIFVIGVSEDRLSAEQLSVLNKCKVILSAKRFTPLLKEVRAEIIPITPLAETMEKIEVFLQQGSVGVLASGDPLFFGIGSKLINRFGAMRVHIFPALSAVQLACASFRVSWDKLTILTLHGRNPQNFIAQILSNPATLIFTDNHNRPDSIAAMIDQTLAAHAQKQRIESIRVRVAENIGLANQQLFAGNLQETARKRFAPLNMMLIEQDLDSFAGLTRFGLQEAEIKHSRGLISKDEIRAVILHCLRLPAHGVFWDVGGGSGSISLEAAGMFPELEIYTVEKKPEEQQNIRFNLAACNRYTIQLVAGEAPEALEKLPAPKRVFIGGSGGKLEQLINYCGDRLQAGGLIVVSAVLKKTAESAPQIMKKLGFTVETRTVSVVRKKMDGAEVSLNPITIITGRK